MGISSHSRIESIDLLRGMVMVIMALDHSRMYFGLGSWYADPTNFKYHDTFIIFYKVDNPFLRPGLCIPSRHFSFFIRYSQQDKERSLPVLIHERRLVVIRRVDYRRFWLDI